jgi:putative spermidine/putrescine transport system ATP-binding protein
MTDGTNEVLADSVPKPASPTRTRLRDRIASGIPGWSAKVDFFGDRHGVPISIRGVTKVLGKQQVLRGIDIDIETGEFLTLLGPSGSGKTTLLMTIAGFVSPDTGTIGLGGRDVTTLAPHLRDIGVVFQSYALFPHMNVEQNIAYPLKLRREPKAEIAHRVDYALQLVRLPGFGSRDVMSLSGGQRQRVAVARAIVFRPRILLMDEPLSALDKPLRETMQIELRRLHSELGLTTVYVTHDQKEALTLSDRIAVMQSGGIAQIGSSHELYSRPSTAFVGRFLGESSILDVEVRSKQVFLAGKRIDVGSNIPPAEKHGLLIRPERLQSLRQADTIPDGMIRFSGIVRDVIFQGDSYRTEIVLADGSSIAMRTSSFAGGGTAVPVPGQKIEVGLAREDATIVADSA